MRQAHKDTLQGFDSLPDSALVRMPVVAALFGVTGVTITRWVKAGHMPAPVEIGGTQLWRVKSIRQKLAAA